jgi:hypothetical protein
VTRLTDALCANANANVYQPDLMEVTSVRRQTAVVKSVSLRFIDSERARTRPTTTLLTNNAKP